MGWELSLYLFSLSFLSIILGRKDQIGLSTSQISIRKKRGEERLTNFFSKYLFFIYFFLHFFKIPFFFSSSSFLRSVFVFISLWVSIFDCLLIRVF